MLDSVLNRLMEGEEKFHKRKHFNQIKKETLRSNEKAGIESSFYEKSLVYEVLKDSLTKSMLN